MIPVVILVAVVAIAIVIVAATAAALTRKIPRRTERKGKKLILKKNIFIRLTNIKEKRIMTNTSIKR